MRNKIVSAVLCVGLLSLFWVCQGTDGSGTNVGTWQAPDWADTLKNTNRVAVGESETGETLYNTYCMSCHGVLGEGDGALGGEFDVKPANFHLPSVQNQKDGALFWKISEGKDAMPAYKTSLTDEQRWQLVAYLRTLYDAKNNVKPEGAVDQFLPIADFAIDPALSSLYIPLPTLVSNAIKSEKLVFMVDTVIDGIDRPWGMAFLPDYSILITTRRDGLLQVKNGKLEATPIGGDIPDGLRDIRLHPQFEKNKLIYLTYYIEPTDTDGAYTVLMRGRLNDDELIANEILYKAGPFKEGGETYGSRITFDLEGFLYITVGQRTIDERHRWQTVQDKSNPSGKVMRLRDDGSIPDDNPFVDSIGALPEIYTYGHRQPQGLSVHPLTGEIWETEHGELGGSELNVLKKGANYGWPLVTFSRNYDGTLITDDTTRAGMESPIQHWTPSIAPSGFDFVYGDRYPGWEGNMFVGAMVQHRLNRTVFKDGIAVHNERLLEDVGRIRDVRLGPDRFLYLMIEDKKTKKNSRIVRLIPLVKK